MTWTKKWDEMTRYEMVLTRQVPEPEWYPAGLAGEVRNRTDPSLTGNKR